MPPKYVAPRISLQSFSCPHCGALADQTWFTVGAEQTKEGEPPRVATMERIDKLEKDKDFVADIEENERVSFFAYFRRIARGEVFLEYQKQTRYDRYNLENIHISRCFSCKDITIWKYDTLFYPREKYQTEPNADLNDDIRRDFDEAREVLDISPRSAAALLRQCIQKLCKQLGLSGDINADIGELVKKGLAPQIQKALDIVRVIGNESVHPGTMNMKDDRETATKLFELVNRIAYDMLTHPKELDALYAELPASKLAGIAQRDAPKSQ